MRASVVCLPALLRRAVIAGGLIATAGMPAHAQETASGSGWAMGPSVGILIDKYDAGDDGSRTGALVSAHVEKRISGPFSGTASVGYSRVNDVGAHSPASPSRNIYRNEWIFVAAGPAVELPMRRAAISLAVQVGAAWRRSPISGSVGDPVLEPSFGNDEFSARTVILPSASVSYPLTQRIALAANASAYVLNSEESTRTSPAFSVGLSLRP